MSASSIYGLPLLEQFLQIKSMSLRASYSTREAAEVLDCSRRTILNYVYDGLLKRRRLPGRKAFLPCDLEDLLQRRPA